MLWLAVTFRWVAGIFTLLVGATVFGQVQTLPFPNARSAFGPSIAVMDETVFAGWRGSASPGSEDDDQQLYLAALRNSRWDEPIQLPAKSMFSPALAVSGETLFIAWHGPGNLFSGAGDSAMSFGSYVGGRGFRFLGKIPKAASAGPPSLAVYKGLIYAAWRGLGNVTVGMVPGNEHWIMYATYDPRTERWSSEDNFLMNIVHANSTAGPSLATVGDRLYAVWRGTGSITFYGPNSDPGDPTIYYASFDGNAWSAQTLPLPTIPGEGTAWGASACEWNGQLWVGWRGIQPWDGGDQSLHFAILKDGKLWQPIRLLKDFAPVTAFGPSLASNGAKLWIAWRGAYLSARNFDDQSLYLTSFDASALASDR